MGKSTFANESMVRQVIQDIRKELDDWELSLNRIKKPLKSVYKNRAARPARRVRTLLNRLKREIVVLRKDIKFKILDIEINGK